MRKIKLSLTNRLLAWALIWSALLLVLTPIITSDDLSVFQLFGQSFVTLEDEALPWAALSEPDVRASGGSIIINYANPGSSQIRAQFSANGGKNNVVLKADGTNESFAPQHGSGNYSVQILKRISPTDNRYTTVKTVTVNVSVSDTPSTSSSGATSTTPTTYNGPYLGSSSEVNWSASLACVKKAQELTSGKKTNSEKAKAIHSYLAQRLTYDVEIFRRQSLPAGYKPSPDNTYRSQSGICYDFSALFAAMCRSVGVPTKLVKGYADMVSGYHAWNEVDMDGKWIVVDLSVDAQYRVMGKSYSMEKSSSKYRGTGSF